MGLSLKSRLAHSLLFHLHIEETPCFYCILEGNNGLSKFSLKIGMTDKARPPSTRIKSKVLVLKSVMQG